MAQVSKGERAKVTARIDAELMAAFRSRAEELDVPINDAIMGAFRAWIDPDKYWGHDEWAHKKASSPKPAAKPAPVPVPKESPTQRVRADQQPNSRIHQLLTGVPGLNLGSDL